MLLKNLTFVGLFFSLTSLSQAPQVICTIVIDQFSYDELQKLVPFMQGGLKKLYNNGVVYTNAFHPHGMPETGPGHATIGTGAFAKDHGIVANKFPVNNKLQECDDDSPENAAVFSPDGVYNFGKSAHTIRVDTLADQCALASTSTQKNTIFSLSLKSRAAIGMSGRKGQPFWLDEQTGRFTSSKAFFTTVPDWVQNFNQEKQINKLTSFIWRKAYPDNFPGYQFPEINNYKNTEIPHTLINQEHEIHKKISKRETKPYDLYMKTPLANQLLLDFAYRCFELHKPTEHERLLLNISLSSKDKIGHIYGPQSIEALDMLYHIDQQLGVFMDKIFQQIDPKKVLFVLSADHGVSPIPWNLYDDGIEFAGIRNSKTLKEELNRYLQETIHTEELIAHVTMPYLYFNQDTWALLHHKQQKKVYRMIKQFLRKLPFLQDVWSAEELIKLPFKKHDLRWSLQNQQFQGRSGNMIMLLQPYNYLTKYSKGTTHVTPYNNDRHIPVIFYQPQVHEYKKINDRVLVTQIAVTLAHLLDVPRPTACQGDLLPGLS